VKYFVIVILGILMSLAGNFFVKATGLYTGGTSACFQGLARLVYTIILKGYGGYDTANSAQKEMATIVYNILFWFVYVLFNIPLTIFAYKKLNKRFASLTIVYLVIGQGMGFI
jgi:uncharacterized membrane-anchored protein YitT (DUF2179 family)